MEKFLATTLLDDGPRFDPTTPQKTRAAAHAVLQRRKTWKVMKATREKVWPGYIESALIEGLEKYRPESNADPKTFKRFPRRNRWISDYIRSATGKVRTPKQVGSRLQQLRDTCRNPRILKLLSRREYSPEVDNDRSLLIPQDISMLPSSTTSSPSPSSTVCCEPPSLQFHSHASPSAKEFVFVFPMEKTKFNPPAKKGITVSFEIPIDNPEASVAISSAIEGQKPNDLFAFSDNNHAERLSYIPVIDANSAQMVIQNSRPLRYMLPFIMFTSSMKFNPQTHRSFFRVFRENQFVYSQWVPLACEPIASKSKSGKEEYIHCMYRSPFIPAFWEHMCNSSDPYRYVVIQEVRRAPFDSDDAVDSSTDDEILLTIKFQFKPPRGLTPTTSNPELMTDVSLYLGDLPDTQQLSVVEAVPDVPHGATDMLLSNDAIHYGPQLGCCSNDSSRATTLVPPESPEEKKTEPYILVYPEPSPDVTVHPRATVCQGALDHAAPGADVLGLDNATFRGYPLPEMHAFPSDRQVEAIPLASHQHDYFWVRQLPSDAAGMTFQETETYQYNVGVPDQTQGTFAGEMNEDYYPTGHGLEGECASIPLIPVPRQGWPSSAGNLFESSYDYTSSGGSLYPEYSTYPHVHGI